MAAPAAILILAPSLAAAEVCEQPSGALAGLFPALDQWIEVSPDKEQYRQLLEPSTWITGALLIWLIASNTTKSTITAAVWFVCVAIFHAYTYFTMDVANPAIQAQILQGCVEHSPYRIFTNLGFAAVALVLTVQRLRRQKA